MFDLEQRLADQKIREICTARGLPDITLSWSAIPFSGHWGIATSFFQMAARQAQGQNINVAHRAQELSEMIAGELGLPQGFERVEAVRGYLNLYFSTGYYARQVVDTVVDQKDSFGYGPRLGQQVMVEFSQPNTHKAFHVGHLRNMFLGNAVANMTDAAGYDVVRTNYIGDIGLHVVKWLWNYLKRHAGEEPETDKTRWMGDLYAEADKNYDSPEAQAEVKTLFARWDKRDPEILGLWRKTRQWSMDGFEEVYGQMGISFDHIYYESEVEDPGKLLVDELIRRGLASDERPEGAVIINLDKILGTREKFRVLVILRSDGTSLYSTKDLALAIRKFEQYPLVKSIYVIDVRQSLYLQQIFKTLELMGYDWAKDRCHHLAYEIVNLPGNVTMSSRDGTVVLLEDLVREATARAFEIVQTKNPELGLEKQQSIARTVALGAIKYSMLSRDNTKIVTFDWQSALDFNGQAAPYIQYAAVRAGSILRKMNSSLPLTAIPDYPLSEQEIQLVEMISRLPREVQRAAMDYKPLYLSNLAYELARAFNDFYNTCPVLQAEEHIRSFRLRLTAASRQAIMNCLSILGIATPEVM